MKSKIEAIKIEIKRTLEAIDEVEKEYAEDEYLFMNGSKATGRLRRRTMDLSEALINYRKKGQVKWVTIYN